MSLTQGTRAGLTSAEREAAAVDGFFVVEGLLSAAQVAACLSRLAAYADGSRPIPAGVQVQREPRVERGEVVATVGAGIRKIEGLASADDVFVALARREEIVSRMRELVAPELELYRAAVLMKPAGVGSAKGMHQDAPYWPFAPMTQWSCWIAFDPATTDNGCMTAIPGSHQDGPRPHVSVGDDFVVPAEHFDAGAARAIPMAPGSGLFFHSLLLHGTAANTSSHPRRAITISYMAASSRHSGEGPRPRFPRLP